MVKLMQFILPTINLLIRCRKKPVVQQLVPLPESKDDHLNERQQTWDYLYEPEPKALLDSLLVRYLESQIYQAVVDNVASRTSWLEW